MADMPLATRVVAALERVARDEPIGDVLRDSRAGPTVGLSLAEALRGGATRTTLRELDLYGLDLTDAGAVPLLRVIGDTTLCRSLDLGANGLDRQAAAALAPLLLLHPPKGADDAYFDAWATENMGRQREVQREEAGLHTLRLSRNALSGAAVAAMLSPLIDPDGTLALSTLALSFNPLGEAGGAALGAALRTGRLPKLTALELHGCELGSAGATSLASGLPMAISLAHLNLCSSALGDGGAIAIAAALPSAPSLLELLLSHNNLTDASAHALATSLVKRSSGLASGCKLRTLSLSNNKLRDAAAAALAEAIGAHRTPGWRLHLESLDLRNNKLGPEALLALGDALVRNRSLISLDLSANRRISDADLQAISELLRQNAAARRGLPPLEAVAPNDAASKLAKLSVRRLFTEPELAPTVYVDGQPLSDRYAERYADGQTNQLTNHQSEFSALSTGPSPSVGAAKREGRGARLGWAHGPPAGASHADMAAGAMRDFETRRLVRDALESVQSELADAAGEVSRLRHREAALEEALRRQLGGPFPES